MAHPLVSSSYVSHTSYRLVTSLHDHIAKETTQASRARRSAFNVVRVGRYSSASASTTSAVVMWCPRVMTGRPLIGSVEMRVGSSVAARLRVVGLTILRMSVS